MLFKIGDRGTIKGFRRYGYHVCVEFDNNIGGHDGDGNRPFHCWYLQNNEIELLERPKQEVKQYGIVKFLEGIK
jgi:hypothetical protein